MGRPEQMSSPFFKVHVSGGVLTSIHWMGASFFFSFNDGLFVLISFPNFTIGFWAKTDSVDPNRNTTAVNRILVRDRLNVIVNYGIKERSDRKATCPIRKERAP